MLPPRQRLRNDRKLRLEGLESRLYLSANPIADFSLDHFVEQSTDYELQAAAVPGQSIGLDRVLADYGFSGAGQTVAIIDTGIAYDHVALGGGFGSAYRVVGGYDFAERDSNPYDDGPLGSHGTHVAGIIGSTDASAIGVAPGADIVSLRVFDDQGNGKFSWVEEALAWVHTHRNSFENPITTVNLSLGVTANVESVPSWATLEDEFAQLEADGIFISVAAGNSFATYRSQGLSYPAVSSHVVPVASVDANGGLSYFSQRDDRVIAALGRSVLSTVPDYVGNHNGIADDFARYSGTSMAAPLVAGASMLLREAYEFAGITSVTEQTLYNTMFSTADVIYDAITGANYHRLNLDSAIEAIMPADDFGSTAGAATSLGTLSNTLSLAGTIGKLSDQDWFSFKAGASGKVTLQIAASGELTPQWDAANLPADAVLSGNTVTFSAVAGQTYNMGVSTGAGIGHYTLDLKLEPIQAKSLVAQVGQEVRIAGTAGDDNVILSVGDVYRLTVNGIEYQFDRRAVNSFVFDGSGGRDTIVIQTASGGATAMLQPGAVDLNGSGYKIHADNVEYVTVRAGAGSNRVTLYDSAGDDVFVATPGYTELRGPGFVNRAEGFSSVCAVAGRGHDVAWLYDSAGSDTLAVAPMETTLSGRGFSNRARCFDEIHASGEAGGYDVAVLYNSTSNMVLRGAGKSAEVSFGTTKTLLGGYERLRAVSFERKTIRNELAAVDFVLELISLRA